MPGVTDEIKDRIDIVEFISAYVPLRKAGRSFVGFCPFHPNTRTPAFTVYPDTHSYHCFGCKASGTVFDFLMAREGLEFRDALEQLARRAGVQLRERTEADEQQDQVRTRLIEVHAAAATFFHHMLVKSPRGEPARAYVARRCINDAAVEAFQLGYCPDEWSALIAYLTDRKGFDPEEVEAAGLAIRRESGGYYDRFRGRLMFPIRSPKGEVIGFGGRAFGDAQPKYLNSPQTALFDKSRVLYGLDLARDAIRGADAAVIVEGYVDVVIAHQHGFRNVVAPLGTALTAEHAGALKRLARQIYLALDADAAGARATLKGVETLHANLDGHAVPVPTPQGFIRWERELDAIIKVIALPEGQDPDEIIQASPDQWRALVAGAQPMMDFYVTTLTADLDLRSAKGKAEAVARLAPLIAQIANPIEQAHYIQQVARLIDVADRVVREALPGRRQTAAAPRPAIAAGESPGQEDYLLCWLLRYPGARTAVQEKIRRDLAPFPLIAALIEGILLELFEGIANREIWKRWSAQPDDTDAQQWLMTLDEALKEQAQRISMLTVPESQSYRYMSDVLECAKILQLHQARKWKDRLSQQVAAAEDADECAIALERLVQIKEYIGALSTPKRSSTYADLHSLHAP